MCSAEQSSLTFVNFSAPVPVAGSFTRSRPAQIRDKGSRRALDAIPLQLCFIKARTVRIRRDRRLCQTLLRCQNDRPRTPVPETLNDRRWCHRQDSRAVTGLRAWLTRGTWTQPRGKAHPALQTQPLSAVHRVYWHRVCSERRTAALKKAGTRGERHCTGTHAGR